MDGKTPPDGWESTIGPRTERAGFSSIRLLLVGSEQSTRELRPRLEGICVKAAASMRPDRADPVVLVEARPRDLDGALPAADACLIHEGGVRADGADPAAVLAAARSRCPVIFLCSAGGTSVRAAYDGGAWDCLAPGELDEAGFVGALARVLDRVRLGRELEAWRRRSAAAFENGPCALAPRDLIRQGEGSAPARGAPAGREQATGTVLVVDDEEAVRRMTRAMLLDAGHQVIEANGAEQALAELERMELRVDLLVTDVLMPGMNGVELADKIAALCPEVAVLFVSGYAGCALVGEPCAGHPVSFLQKPFSAAELVAAAAELLGRRGGGARDRGIADSGAVE